MVYYQPVIYHSTLEEPFYCSQVYKSHEDAISHGETVAERMGLYSGETVLTNVIFVSYED